MNSIHTLDVIMTACAIGFVLVGMGLIGYLVGRERRRRKSKREG